MSNKYKVLANFTDAEDKAAPDGANAYYTGGEYPRDGYSPAEGRIKALQGEGNKLKKPLISDKPIVPQATPVEQAKPKEAAVTAAIRS